MPLIDLNGLGYFKGKENAMVAGNYSASNTYAVGDYVYYSGTLYRCTTAITTAEAWTAAHWTAAKLADDLTSQSEKIDELKSALSAIGVEEESEELTLDVTHSKYINGQGEIADAGGNYEVGKCEVTVGAKYLVTGSTNWSSPYYAFYDSDMTLVEKGKASEGGSTVTSIIDYEVVAPSGAKYIVVTGNTSGSAEKVKSTSVVLAPLDDLEEDVATIEQASGEIIDKTLIIGLVDTNSYRIKDDGSIVEAAGNYAIRKGEVIPNSKYLITASANWSGAYYAFYEDDMTLVSVGSVNPGGSTVTYIEDEVAIAPANSKYIVVNWITSGDKEAKVKQDDGKKYAKAWYGKKWVCVGDSLTAINSYTTKHYFDFVSDETDITVVNMGVSGSGYARGSGTNEAFYQRISDCPVDADIVTIFGSFNDLGAGLDLGDVDDTGTSTIAGCINTTLDNLITIIPTVIVGIITPTPWETARPIPSSGASNYVDLLIAIAEYRSIPCLDLFRCSNLRPWDSDFRTLAYSNDGGNGVHPNNIGHQIIAPKFEAFLDKLLLH